MEESKANIRSLESFITTFKTQKDDIRENDRKVNNEVDIFIDKQIELLQRKRQSLKAQLRRSVTTQMESLNAQSESLNVALGCQKSSVEFTEEALRRGNEVEVLSGKKQLTELNSANLDLKSRGLVHVSLEAVSPFNYDTYEKMAKIKEYDEGYEFGIVDGSGELKRLDSANSQSDQLTNFCVRPKSRGLPDSQNKQLLFTLTVTFSPKHSVRKDEYKQNK